MDSTKGNYSGKVVTRESEEGRKAGRSGSCFSFEQNCTGHQDPGSYTWIGTYREGADSSCRDDSKERKTEPNLAWRKNNWASRKYREYCSGK
ncbi:unnamed protein product [Cylicostephanus goldi]|uniref:Uncharacterized protein n=1 Tax=Cylicostephanus goldi TaxID=71465 RepID=A0A3P6SKT6_CYLGO|nr:unnamed protein product [Cylicostephanus goldi]